MNNGQPTVMIVDDEDMVITSVRAFLQLETEYSIHGFNDPQEAIRHLQTNPVDVVISDYLMPRMNGMELLERLAEQSEPVAVVLLTAQGSIDTAVDAMKSGAYDGSNRDDYF